MKRNLLLIGSVVGVLTLLWGCTDLSEQVFSDLTLENFDPSNVDAVIAPAYATLRDVYFGWHGNFDTQEESSDQIVTPTRGRIWYDGGVYIAMHMHWWTPTQSHVNALWNRVYAGINNTNRAIYQIENGPDFDGKENLLAELRVLRAFYYYLLLDNFRNVPIITRFDIPADSLPAQSNGREVFQFVEREILDNLDLLSEEVSVRTYGRFHKWAALALLADLYLNAEVYTSTGFDGVAFQGGTPRWEDVISVTDQIINSGLFILEPDYSAPFKTDNHNSSEIIFAVPYDEQYGPWFHLHSKTLHPANQATYNIEHQPWNGNGGAPWFIDTYDPEDLRLKKTWIMGLQRAANGDTLYCSQQDSLIGKPLIFENELVSVFNTAENDLYRIGKYEIKMGARWSLSNDFPIYRYARILMMKAEALLRLGDAAGAAELVNQVRARAFEPDKPVSPEELTLDRFLMELGWEFVAEAKRRQDLIRFGKFTTESWGPDHKPNGHHRIIFPIPQQALNTNPNLVQNPGY